MNKKKLITYRHLERLLTCQEYFVWNQTLDYKIKDIVEEENAKTDGNYLWKIFTDFEENEINDYQFVEVVKNAFKNVNDLLINQIKKWSNIENKRIITISEKSNELAFIKTMEAINNSNIDWIINPIFIYENLISKPSLYIKNKKEVYSLNYGSKTKLKNYIRSYFDFNVLKKLNIDVEEYLIFIYDNKKDYYQPNDLSFNITKYCWLSKTGGPNNKTKTTVEENTQYESIIEKLKSGIIKKNNKNNKIEVSLYLEDFDKYIQKIIDAQNSRIPIGVEEEDNTIWGTNLNFLNIFNFEKFNLKKYSGNIINKNDLLLIQNDQRKLKQLIKEKKSLNYLVNNISYYNKEVIIEYVEKIKNSHVVWYDFEGFSLPYVIISHSKPFQQIVFQVSVIETKDEKIIKEEDLVLDPKHIQVNDFKIIIDNIYNENADWYVVYNKGYELTRLKEMIDLISRLNDDSLLEYQNKVNQIKEKTIDLFDLFQTSSSKENIPPIFIPDLLGFSSIKKIEKYINENKIKLEVMIEPYDELHIQNGLMAMNKAIQRYLLSIHDNEWAITSTYLKRYCKNDVKAMIMVYFFVKKLL